MNVNPNWIDIFLDPPPLADAVLKISVVLAVGWLVHGAIRRRNPRWRVLLWRGVAMGVVVLPPIGVMLPGLSVPVVPPPPASSGRYVSYSRHSVLVSAADSLPPMGMAGGSVAPMPRPSRLELLKADAGDWIRTHPLGLLLSGWLAVAAIIGVGVVQSGRRFRKVVLGARPAPQPVLGTLKHVCGELGWKRPVVLLASAEIASPVLVGVRRPTILLPENALAPDRHADLTAILAHEISHIKSRDLLWSRVIQALSILLWFHPLAWRIRGAHASACEEVSDAVAADFVGDRAAYSGTLARVALALVRRRQPLGGIPMARRSQIGERLAILKTRIRALPIRKRWVFASLSIGFLAMAGLGGLKLTYAQETSNPPVADEVVEAPSEGDQRVLHFPKDRSLGTVLLLDTDTSMDEEFYNDKERQGNWKEFAQARGDVVIPAGKRVYLSVGGQHALRDLSPLALLRPDDLDRLAIGCWQVSGVDVDRDILPHITGLTGLKILSLSDLEGIPKRLSMLAKLENLQHLSIRTKDAMFDRGRTARSVNTTGLKSLDKLKSVKSLFFASSAINDQTLEYIAKMPWLREFAIYNNRFQGSGLRYVAQLPQLEYLFIGSKSMRPDNLRYVAGCTSLRKLAVQEFPATDSHLALLKPLRNLEVLDLYDTAVTDRGFVHLKPLQSLRRLLVHSKGARGSTIRNDGLIHLRALPNLEAVWLWGNDITNVGIAHLAALPKLKQLELSSVDYNRPEDDRYFYDDKGLEALSGLENLELLRLGSPAITDEGLAHLANLKKLRRLNLSADLVTNAGLVHIGKMKSLENLTLKSHKYTLSGLNALNGLAILRELHVKGLIQDNEGLDLSGLVNLEKVMLGMRNYRENGKGRYDHIRAEDMAWLANIKGLRWLQGLRGVTDEGLKHIAGLTKMERLSFFGRGVTDAGLAYLADMKMLSLLSIQNCNVSDEGLRHLKGLESLTFVNITSNNAFSQGAIDRLRTKLPNLVTVNIVP